jgi:flagellar basal-body rod protein FlgB
MSGLIDSTMSVLGKALDGLTSRQAAISSNLANIDTPGYAPATVDFETALQQEVAGIWGGTSIAAKAPNTGVAANVAMARTNPRHFSKGSTGEFDAITKTDTTAESIRNDGNQVDLETEMTALTETQIQFQANSKLITAKFQQLYDVLGGR